MPYQLPPLPYPYTGLEPYFDARTMEIHHDKHHAAYVTKLNDALNKHPDLFAKTLPELLQNLETVPEEIRTTVRNNGGGHFNHNFFWNGLKKGGNMEPKGKLKEDIEKIFSSFTTFKTKFSELAANHFASGWAWLYVNKGKQLIMATTPGHDSPIMNGEKPILVLDLWEHSYYLKYQNRRPDYIAAWFNLIDWGKAADIYLANV